MIKKNIYIGQMYVKKVKKKKKKNDNKMLRQIHAKVGCSIERSEPLIGIHFLPRNRPVMAVRPVLASHYSGLCITRDGKYSLALVYFIPS